ncbi:hypothetical protein BC943DRAFT_330141 [Umbelopsis sp. AD052]|nr:hypothetical protein BC943DRAFT_330141 [Umbelopsis sp. AD052]
MTTMPTPEKWECLKRIVKYTALQYSQGSHKFNKNTICTLQQKRMRMLEVSQVPTTNLESLDELKREIEKLELIIEEKTLNETKQFLLRSATKWHEEGERSNKYFFRVIKQRQSQQTMQFIRSAETDKVENTTGKILKEARNFYIKLFTPDDIDQEATEELMAAIPDGNKHGARAQVLMVYLLNCNNMLWYSRKETHSC